MIEADSMLISSNVDPIDPHTPDPGTTDRQVPTDTAHDPASHGSYVYRVRRLKPG
jgi:hypothetical protein